MTCGINRHLALLLRVGFGLVLLGFLFYRADLEELVSGLRHVDLRLIVVVLVLPHLAIAISVLKWQLLLREFGISRSFVTLFNVYLVGTFFSNFLPTMVGGDAVRIYSVNRTANRMASVTAATFMERYAGFAALISLLPLAVFQRSIKESNVPVVLIVVSSWTVCCLVGLVVCWKDLPSGFIVLKSKWSVFERLFSFLGRVRNDLRMYAKSPLVLIYVYLLSFLFYVITAASSWAALSSTGATLSYWYVVSVVPFILLSAMVPLSLNGLGVTEAGYVLFFNMAGVPIADALTAAVVLRFRLLLSAAIGGILFLADREKYGGAAGNKGISRV